jgi:hypothetical protein
MIDILCLHPVVSRDLGPPKQGEFKCCFKALGLFNATKASSYRFILLTIYGRIPKEEVHVICSRACFDVQPVNERRQDV